MQRCAICGGSFSSEQLTDVHEEAAGRLISRTMCDACLESYMNGKAGVGVGPGRAVTEYDSSSWANVQAPDLSRRSAMHACPGCGSECSTLASPFSSSVSLFVCPKGHFIAVRCPSCQVGTMQHVGDLDFTVHTKCNKCSHQSSGIPKAWWHQKSVPSNQVSAERPWWKFWG